MVKFKEMHKDNQDRVNLLNAIIEKMGYEKYLEIGIDNPEICFNHIKAVKKMGIDPYDDKLGTHKWNADNVEDFIAKIEGDFFHGTSDEFFTKKRNKFDLIFIDGLHLEEQVDKDIQNSLSRLRAGGMIVLHDTMPRLEKVATPNPEPGQPWMGTVYRSFWKLRQFREDLDLCTVDRGTGFSFIRPGKNVPYIKPNFKGHMSFMYLNLHRYEVMNVVPWEAFKKAWLVPIPKKVSKPKEEKQPDTEA